MAAQTRVPLGLRDAGDLRSSHSVERNTLARPLESEPAAESRKAGLHVTLALPVAKVSR